MEIPRNVTTKCVIRVPLRTLCRRLRLYLKLSIEADGHSLSQLASTIMGMALDPVGLRITMKYEPTRPFVRIEIVHVDSSLFNVNEGALNLSPIRL